jgi:hypothetical protein
MQEQYNVSQEMERKRALSMVLSQTRQQEKKDEEVLFFKIFIILYVPAICLPSL